MVHRGRFLASLSLGPAARPPIALRYAMWTLAAGMSDQYSNMQEHFYRRSRKYIQQEEMRSFGEGIIALQYCQAWILLAIYEFKNMQFPRAWLSTGRAVRSAQMLGLHRMDGEGLAVKTCLAPPADWTEREERRRTFWMAFWEDRCASIGTGWPMTIDERDVSFWKLNSPLTCFANNTPSDLVKSSCFRRGIPIWKLLYCANPPGCHQRQKHRIFQLCWWACTDGSIWAKSSSSSSV